MKISVSSYSFSKCRISYTEMCDKAKEMGYDGIEFTTLSPETVEKATEIKEYCRKIGLPITAYCVSANLNTPFGKRAVEKVKRHIDIAAALGAPVLRHDVCYALRPFESIERAIGIIAPRIREITAYAREKGIVTMTENHGFIFQAPERMKLLMDTVGDDNYRWLCDIGNFLCVGADPVVGVKTALPYVKHVHVKDFFVTDKPKTGSFPSKNGKFLTGTIVGRGDVPVSECVSYLKESGYDGYYTVEFEGTEDPFDGVREGLAFLRNL